MYKYKVIESSFEGYVSTVIERTGEDGISWIPADESNPDYQAYLASLEGTA